MKNQSNFKGRIYQVSMDKKKPLLKYDTTPSEHQFHQSMMSSFRGIEFSAEEKQKLSRNHRKNLYNYLNINTYELNREAMRLIDLINYSTENFITIEASDYGAFICLTAIYSGKLSKSKKVNFKLENSPVGLFPGNLLKKSPNKMHTFKYQSGANWIDDFQTLCVNKQLRFLESA